MKLYYIPSLCSLASHIAAREAGLDCEFIKVDYKSKTADDGKNYLDVNPLGYVPALALDDGTVLTESPAILQFIADQVPGRRLVPATGTIARYRAVSLLHILGAEIHKRIVPLADPRCADDFKAELSAKIAVRFAYLEAQLGDQAFFMGSDFSIVDAYAFAIIGGARDFFNFDFTPYPGLLRLMERVSAREQVIETLRVEGTFSFA